jgi:hypothetical protein
VARPEQPARQTSSSRREKTRIRLQYQRAKGTLTAAKPAHSRQNRQGTNESAGHDKGNIRLKPRLYPAPTHARSERPEAPSLPTDANRPPARQPMPTATVCPRTVAEGIVCRHSMRIVSFEIDIADSAGATASRFPSAEYARAPHLSRSDAISTTTRSLIYDTRLRMYPPQSVISKPGVNELSQRICPKPLTGVDG